MSASTFGWLLRTYLAARQRQLELEQDRQMSAGVSQGMRLGQFEAATEADSVIDEAQRALVLIHNDGGPQMRAALAAWKASLAAAIREEAVYLSETLLRWQSLCNLDPDLALSVNFDLANSSPVIISRAQAAQLWEKLGHLQPRGFVRVDVRSPATTLPAQDIDLLIDEAAIHLDGDCQAGFQFDLAPLACGYTAVMLLLEMGNDFGAVPVVVSLAGACMYAALGWWGHLRLPQASSQGRQKLAYRAVGTGLVYAVIASRTVRRARTSAGQINFPAAGLLQGLTVTLVTLSPGLEHRDRRRSAVTMGGIALVSWGALRQRPALSELMASLVWPVATAATAVGLTRALDDQVRSMTISFENELHQHVDEARKRGVRWVQSWCDEITADAIARLPAIENGDPLTAEAARRLAALRSRIDRQETPECGL